MPITLTRRDLSAGFAASTAALMLSTARGFAEGFSAKDRRIALVVGNWKYQFAGILNSPAMDAKAVATALRRLHYDVKLLFNTDAGTLEKEIAEFSRRAAISNMAVMYYSGHGMQFGDTNYLIPINANIVSSGDIDEYGIPVNWAVDAVGSADAVGVVILDACRDNPFVSALRKSPTSRHDVYKNGLAPVDPKSYFLVSYATGANQFAQDGSPHQLSPYAGALIAQIEAADLSVQEIFARVVTSVCDVTTPAGVPGDAGPYPACQRPAVYSTLGVEPVFMTERPDHKAKVVRSPVLVDIKMADPADPAVNKVLGKDNVEFNFRYLWRPSAEDGVGARITPDLDYFLSAEDRGRPLIIAADMGYYAPDGGAGVWLLSYPILDLIARRIVAEPVKIAALVVEAQSSRADNTPYLGMVTPGTDVGLITLVNQSWQKIKTVKLEFDIVGRKFMSDVEVKDHINKRPEGPFKISVTVNNIDDSKNVSLVEAIKPQFSEIERFVFAARLSIAFDKSGRMTLTPWDEQKFDKSGRLIQTIKGKKIDPPPGFEEWYGTVRSEYEQGEVDPLWIAGRVTAIGEDGEPSEADFAAALMMYLPGVGGGTINYDLIDYIVLPIDGKGHTITKQISMTLGSDKQTFRGLFPLTARQTSFHRLRFSLKDAKGGLLFESPWAATHIVVSRNDKIAALGKNWKKY